MKAILCFLLIFAANAWGVLAPGYVEVDDIHTDIAMPYIGAGLDGAWQNFVHTGNTTYAGNYTPDMALLMVNETTQTTRPAGAQFDFLGVRAGDPVWKISATPVPGQLYLGIEAQYGFASGQMEASNDTNWKRWDPDGTGPATSFRYVMLNVVAVRGPGYFSIYDSGPFGDIQVRVDSADGLDAFDGLPQIINSHAHYNWAFTAPGYYEVDFQAHTVLGPNSGPGTAISSQVETFHFMVVPEPGSAVLLLFGGALLVRRRRAFIDNTSTSST